MTAIVRALYDGRWSAAERLLPLVYDELRTLASHWFRRGKADHTIQPTAFVHEAYMHPVDQTSADWRDQSHFFAVAALARRQIVIQHARRRNALKRGGDWGRITLSGAAVQKTDRVIDVLDLDDALNNLAQLHERQAKVVELRFVGDLNVEEVADVLDVSPRTVESD